MTAWPFTDIELTAGLRRYLADPKLRVVGITEEPAPLRIPSTPVRGIGIDVERWNHHEHYSYLLTQPCSIRYGLPGGARHEVGFHRSMTLNLPIIIPELVAADPRGSWMILEPYTTLSPSAEWSANDYRQAVINLAGFHDQFWGVHEDLSVYPWVAFPLEKDFEAVCRSAAEAVERIVHEGRPHSLCNSMERMSAVAQLLTQADTVARVLRTAPQTLLHGDYWPGNIIVDEDERHVVYDWQAVSAGPGILDLVNFVNKSRMYYGSLPVETNELVWLYRYTLATLGHNLWDEASWQRLWDYALMWRFLQEQLAMWASPDMDHSDEYDVLLEKIWLQPVNVAVDRQLEKYALI